MIVILEGVDGAGKTTVADNLEVLLAREQPVERWHFGPPDLSRGVLETYLEPLKNWVRENYYTKHLIVDRFHIGEWTYGPLLRDDRRMTESEFQIIEGYLDELFAKKFYVRPHIEIVMDRFFKRGDDLISADDIATLYYEYDLIFNLHNSWAVIDEQLQNLIKHLAETSRKMLF